MRALFEMVVKQQQLQSKYTTEPIKINPFLTSICQHFNSMQKKSLQRKIDFKE